MALTVDNIENGIISCIDSDKNIVELKYDEIVGFVHEGCILVYDETEGKYIIDSEETKSRKQSAHEKLNNLFRKNK